MSWRYNDLRELMKIAIIAIAKCEEPYIKEWIDYHLDKGFSNIIIADNDDTLVLAPYASDRVIIEDYTGVEGVQPKAYNQLFAKYRKDYDWIAFFDIDEFLVIEDGRSVTEFIDSLPQDVDMIRLNCKHFTDNDELDVIDGNYNVFDRFLTPVECDKDRFYKSFVNTKIDMGKNRILGHGIYDSNLKSIGADGKPCEWKKKADKAFLEIAWFNHFRTKTIGEYIRQKYKRGGANFNPQRYSRWREYFRVTNNLTPEKIRYAYKTIREITRRQ